MNILTDDIGRHIAAGLALIEDNEINDDQPDAVVNAVLDDDPSNIRLFVTDGKHSAEFRVTITRVG